MNYVTRMDGQKQKHIISVPFSLFLFLSLHTDDQVIQKIMRGRDSVFCLVQEDKLTSMCMWKFVSLVLSFCMRWHKCFWTFIRFGVKSACIPDTFSLRSILKSRDIYHHLKRLFKLQIDNTSEDWNMISN